MSLDPPFTSLLHPGQMLTVSKADGWARHLITRYKQHIRPLRPFTLDENALQGYAARLETLRRHAGVLEPQLCRMCFFLPEQIVRTVIAIVVATNHQLSLLKSDAGPSARFVLDGDIVGEMCSYMERVVVHFATYDWSGYAQLRGAVGEGLSQMWKSPGQAVDPPRLPVASAAGGYSEYTRLTTFLYALSSRHFWDDDTSLPNPDWRPFSFNSEPFAWPQDSLARLDTDIYACIESNHETPFSDLSSTVYHSDVDSCELRSHFSDATQFQETADARQSTSPPTPPSYIPPISDSPPFSTCSAAHTQRKKRQREYNSDTACSDARGKKPRLSITLHNEDGSISEFSTYGAVVLRVQPSVVGHSDPLDRGLPIPHVSYLSSDSKEPASYSSSQFPSSSSSSSSPSSSPSSTPSLSPLAFPISIPGSPLPTVLSRPFHWDDWDEHMDSASSNFGSDDEFTTRTPPKSLGTETIHNVAGRSHKPPTSQGLPAVTLPEKRSCWVGLWQAIRNLCR